MPAVIDVKERDTVDVAAHAVAGCTCSVNSTGCGTDINLGDAAVAEEMRASTETPLMDTANELQKLKLTTENSTENFSASTLPASRRIRCKIKQYIIVPAKQLKRGFPP